MKEIGRRGEVNSFYSFVVSTRICQFLSAFLNEYLIKFFRLNYVLISLVDKPFFSKLDPQSKGYLQ